MTRTANHRFVGAALSAALLAFLPAVAGCEDRAQRTDGGTGPAGRAPVSAGADTTPYYHGLIEEYRTLLAEDPHSLAVLIAMGNTLSEAGQWRGALEYYDRALRINPHSADVITDMGTCYRNLGMPDKALEMYGRALELEPIHQNALFSTGVVYAYDRKDYAKAIAFWERLLHVAPKHPEADAMRNSIVMFKKTLRRDSP